MAKQLIEKYLYKGGYVDSLASIETFDALSKLSRSKRFIGLTTTVLNGLKTIDGKAIPVDVWLSETSGNWVLKDIPPIDDLSQIKEIPINFIPNGFRVLLKNGKTYVFNGVDENGEYIWESEITRDELPNLDGYATEDFVKNAIADAQLSGGSSINLSEGDGILIDDSNKISVKIAKDTEEKENFIEINENNELELNEITLDAAVISEDIEVNGGAWAEEVESVFDGKIPAGITFEDFLKKMVKKEKYVSDVSTKRVFDVVLCGGTVTLTSNDIDVNEKIVEIGTQIKISKILPSSTKAIQLLSAGSFTYGYKIGKNGEYINSQIYKKELVPNLVETASTIQLMFTKLTKDLNGTLPLESIYITGGSYVDEIVAYVNEGYNSIILCQTGDTYVSNSNIEEKDIYVATSLKNYNDANGNINIYELTFPSITTTATNKITYHVTGVKKYYVGGISEYSKDFWSKGNPSDVIRNLELQNWASGSSIETSYTFKEGTKQQTVAVPSEYTKVIGTDRIGGPVNFELVAKDINFHNQQGYICKYNVFVAPAYDGLNTNSFINITIEK